MRIIVPLVAVLALTACDPESQFHCTHGECTSQQPLTKQERQRSNKGLSRLLVPTLVGLLLVACTNQVQTTSGADYLAAQPQAANGSGSRHIASKSVDKEVRKAASVEPILRFPARIGLARIAGRSLTGIPEAELRLWHNLAREHQNLGEFVTVSPIIAEFTASAVDSWATADQLVSKIRLGAARQHIDAVLIYEVGSNSNQVNTPLAFADFTIFGGALLPTRSLKATGIAEALLLDVRNGYPYGTAHAEADLSSLSTSWGASDNAVVLRAKASLKVIEHLLPEIADMFHKLKRKLPRTKRRRKT